MIPEAKKQRDINVESAGVSHLSEKSLTDGGNEEREELGENRALFLPLANEELCGKVMFLHACVCPHGGVYPSYNAMGQRGCIGGCIYPLDTCYGYDYTQVRNGQSFLQPLAIP